MRTNGSTYDWMAEQAVMNHQNKVESEAGARPCSHMGRWGVSGGGGESSSQMNIKCFNSRDNSSFLNWRPWPRRRSSRRHSSSCPGFFFLIWQTGAPPFSPPLKSAVKVISESLRPPRSSHISQRFNDACAQLPEDTKERARGRRGKKKKKICLLF